MKVVHFASPAAFRKWLHVNHATATEIYVGFYKVGLKKKGASWKEAVDVALCYGWIDGVRKKLDDERYTNRFTPRKKKSYWSEVNKKRFAELEAEGLVHPHGRKVYESRDQSRPARYAFEQHRVLDAASEKAIKAIPKAWAFHSAQAPSYQRIIANWLSSAVKPETKAARLERLIAAALKGQRL
jgi:uncharacterized protein YdeI (YjbR/CyaY-like superfamily)